MKRWRKRAAHCQRNYGKNSGTSARRKVLRDWGWNRCSLRPLYAELVRKHKDEGLSFRNVVIFNLYEYYPLASEGAGSSFSQLNDLFLSQIDIDKQNVFTIDGTIPQEAVIEYCRLYEQRIQTFGGIDIVLMGIGREGNIA